MLYVLVGEDDFSLRRTVEDIKKGIGSQDVLSANMAMLEGQHLTLKQLKGVCETVPFLAEKRLTIVEGLLSRFEPIAKSGIKKKKPIDNQENESKSFADYLGNLPQSSILVLIDGKVTSKNPLLNGISGKVNVKRFPLLKGDRLRQWIQKRVVAEGGSISPEAADALAKLIGGSLWVMTSEINKLVLYASGRRIDEADVRSMVSYAKEANIFTMVAAILEFKTGVAEKLLQQLLREGAAPAYLLYMLSRQVQLIVRARELMRRGRSEAEIQSRLGLPEFALRRVLEQAERHSLARIMRVYHKLLETDLAIKRGRYDGELALNILVAELGQ